LRLLRRARTGGPGWFARFTPAARDTMVVAQKEARALGHNWVGTEHLLLALAVSKSTPAGRALAALDVDHGSLRAQLQALIGSGLDPDALASIGIDLDEVRRCVEEAFGPGALERAGSEARGSMCLTPKLKRAFELAFREALELGHGSIGTEHVLLGLIRAPDNVAVRLLEARDVSPDEIRAAVTRVLAA
jgi:ATP-dependent Clp protease ATP-binding subunit ClpA